MEFRKAPVSSQMSALSVLMTEESFAQTQMWGGLVACASPNPPSQFNAGYSFAVEQCSLTWVYETIGGSN